jgi:hypothetical protein
MVMTVRLEKIRNRENSGVEFKVDRVENCEFAGELVTVLRSRDGSHRPTTIAYSHSNAVVQPDSSESR